MEDGTHKSAAKLTWAKKASSVFLEMMDPTLLRDWIFIWFCVSNFFTSLAFQVPYIFLVDKAAKGGARVSYELASYLLSIIGVANIFGRIGFGFLSDHPKVNRLWLYNLAVIISGLTMCLIFACGTYLKLILFSSFFGLFIGELVLDVFSIKHLDKQFIHLSIDFLID